MGANFLQTVIHTSVEKKFYSRYDQMVQAEKAYYGTNPYSGTWALKPEVRIVSDPFPERKRWTRQKKDAVMEWIMDNAEKWEPALAVKGKGLYLVGAWAPS